MLSGHSSVLKLYPCKWSDLAAEDRGSYTNGRAVKMLSGHSSVLRLEVLAAESKTGLP